MKKVLITGAGSYVGESVRRYINSTTNDIRIDVIDSKGDNWKMADFSKYDCVYHVAGIADVNGGAKNKDLYYSVNRDLTIEVAKHAKECGVKQFIFMSSMIVFHESQSLSKEILSFDAVPKPNGLYGDSKLQAEVGLQRLADDNFKICILRPPMIYGPNSKSNFHLLVKLARITPVFPAWHNKRSMLYIDNLSEFVKMCILNELEGIYYPQNKELADTVEIIRYFAQHSGHRIWISKALNPFVWIGAFFLQPLNKMFATYYYDPQMSKVDFEYQLVSQWKSFEKIQESI